MIESERLILRNLRDEDRETFAALNADLEVARWLGAGPINRPASDAFVDRIRDHVARHGFGLWAIERKKDSVLLGVTGLQHVEADVLPVGPAVEISWRLARHAWGHGFASEAAKVALVWGFENLDVPEIIAFTAIGNARSEAVMRRIGMRREPERDFDHPGLPSDSPLMRHVVYSLRRPAPASRSEAS